MAFHVINVYNYSLRFKMFRRSSSIPSSERSSVTSGSRQEQGPYVTDGEGKWTKKKKAGGGESQLQVHFISHRIKHKIMHHKQ